MTRKLSVAVIMASVMVAGFAATRIYYSKVSVNLNKPQQQDSEKPIAARSMSVEELDLRLYMKSLYQADQFIVETTEKYLGLAGQRFHNGPGRVLRSLKSTYSSSGLNELNKSCQSAKAGDSMIVFTQQKQVALNPKPSVERIYQVQRVVCGAEKLAQVLAEVKINNITENNTALKWTFYNDQLISGVGQQFALINSISECELMVNSLSVIESMTCKKLGQDINRSRHLEISSLVFDSRNEYPIVADMVVKENAVDIFETAAFKVPAQGAISLVIQQAKADVIEQVEEAPAVKQVLVAQNTEPLPRQQTKDSKPDALVDDGYQLTKDTANPAESLGIESNGDLPVDQTKLDRTATTDLGVDTEPSSADTGVEFIEVTHQR